MRPVGDRSEVVESRALEEPPHQSLTGDCTEDHRRGPVGARDEVARQPCQRDDLEAGDGSDLSHEQVEDVRAGRRGPHDDRERRERPAALELGDALAERILELPGSGR